MRQHGLQPPRSRPLNSARDHHQRQAPSISCSGNACRLAWAHREPGGFINSQPSPQEQPAGVCREGLLLSSCWCVHSAPACSLAVLAQPHASLHTPECVHVDGPAGPTHAPAPGTSHDSTTPLCAQRSLLPALCLPPAVAAAARHGRLPRLSAASGSSTTSGSSSIMNVAQPTPPANAGGGGKADATTQLHSTNGSHGTTASRDRQQHSSSGQQQQPVRLPRCSTVSLQTELAAPSLLVFSGGTAFNSVAGEQPAWRGGGGGLL